MTDLLVLPTFVTPDTIHVVVESPKGSSVKLKYDPELHVMTLSRPLTLGVTYPYDWGFVPSTRGPDGDPIDAFVMWDAPSYPGVALECRPIGVLRAEQTNLTSGARERNDRIAAVPAKSPRCDAVHTVLDLAERVRAELEQFFLATVALEGRDLKLLGWVGPGDAMALVRASQKHTETTYA
jgi:inorganic pyrophosphatase